MKKFLTTFLQFVLFAAFFVLLNNYTHANTLNLIESGDGKSKKFQKSDFEGTLYFEKLHLKNGLGSFKNKPQVSHPGNSIFQVSSSLNENNYLNPSQTLFPDVRYELNIHIFPSHYFW